MLIENIKKKVLASLLFGGSSRNETSKLERRTRKDEYGEYFQNFNDEQIQKLIDFIEKDYFKLKEIKYRRHLNKLNDENKR